MPRWDRRCEDGHVFEVSFSTFKAAETAKAAGIPCETCGKPTQTVIGDAPVIYNCAGFYGNVPTQLAHNTGNM